ncbi:putative RNA-directed DNA polymerase [Helianthus annuus]|nr:putative RNA-directed DNA polymerase [Helianthus annuus]
MDVKTAFLNGDLDEDVYMKQPEGFKPEGQEHLVCKLKKSIYGLKQASRQWYLKFDEVMKRQGFMKNQVDQCTYLKMSGSNFTILVLYVDDILLASNSLDMLHESKRLLSHNFDMKDLGDASYVIGVTPQPMAESSGRGTERNRLFRSFHNNYLYNPVKDTSHTVSRINKHVITDNHPNKKFCSDNSDSNIITAIVYLLLDPYSVDFLAVMPEDKIYRQLCLRRLFLADNYLLGASRNLFRPRFPSK